jgi:hypothetical protein
MLTGPIPELDLPIADMMCVPRFRRHAHMPRVKNALHCRLRAVLHDSLAERPRLARVWSALARSAEYSKTISCVARPRRRWMRFASCLCQAAAGFTACPAALRRRRRHWARSPAAGMRSIAGRWTQRAEPLASCWTQRRRRAAAARGTALSWAALRLTPSSAMWASMRAARRWRLTACSSTAAATWRSMPAGSSWAARLRSPCGRAWTAPAPSSAWKARSHRRWGLACMHSVSSREARGQSAALDPAFRAPTAAACSPRSGHIMPSPSPKAEVRRIM